MNIKEVNSLLDQNNITEKLRGEIIATVKKQLLNEFQIEVVVSNKSIVIDVYSEFGKEDSFIFKFPKTVEFDYEDDMEELNEEDVCGL